jgi:hypothetical protein
MSSPVHKANMSASFTLSMTPYDRKRIKEQAVKFGITEGAYIRKVLIDSTVITADGVEPEALSSLD